MTTLMSAFCGFVYTMWSDAVVLENGITVTGTVSFLTIHPARHFHRLKIMLPSPPS